MSDRQTRREMLKTGAAVSSLGVVASLSGCSGESSDGDTDNGTEDNPDEANTDDRTDGNNTTDSETYNSDTASGDTSPTPPNTRFAYSYDPDERTVVVRMSAGDEFDPERVRLEGDIQEDGQTWQDLSGATGRVGAGDSVTVRPTAGREYLLELVWTAESGDTSVRLGVNTGPDRRWPERRSGALDRSLDIQLEGEFEPVPSRVGRW